MMGIEYADVGRVAAGYGVSKATARYWMRMFAGVAGDGEAYAPGSMACPVCGRPNRGYTVGRAAFAEWVGDKLGKEVCDAEAYWN
jgi:hypothetical protein